uniref:Peptidase S1 domain-containing protein n=2 Tax=Ciona intestinalis TaxID=7719 RepID=F6XE75_CIOIN
MEGDEFTEDSAHVLATVCGKLHAGQGPITTVHGKLLLEFRSGNYEVTKRGFQARWVAEALDQPQTECGATSPSSGGNFARLVGGVKEAVENVPWHAAVFSDDVGTRDDNETPLCGATIIRHSYALTAAHCLDHLTSQQQVDKTILGYATSQLWRLTRLSHLLRDSDITVSSMDDDTGASVIRLSRIYSHPTYSENLDSDIVLIKVAEPITWSSRVFPVCLPSPESLLDHVGHGRLHIPKQYCKLAGWGSSSELGDYASDLASIEIPVMSDKHCERSSASLFGRRVNIRATLCAGHFDGTRQSPCKGDDGGGLTCSWNGNHYLVGVAGEQFGECSLLNVPRYFTRVSTFIKWVEDTIRKSKFGYDSNFAKGAREW